MSCEAKSIVVLASVVLSRRESSLQHVWLLFILVILFSVPLWILETALKVELLPGLPLSALMVIVPAGVACSLTGYKHGKAAALVLVERGLLDWQNVKNHAWHWISIGLMPLLLLASYGISVASGLPLPGKVQIFWEDLPLLLLLFFGAAICEEIAWFGVAYEPMRNRFGFFSGSLIIGAYLAIWHFVPYIQAQGIDNISWIIGQCLFIIVFRVLRAWIYEMTNGSVFDVSLCHASSNTAWQLFPNRGSGYNPWVTTGLLTGALLIAVSLSPKLRHGVFVDRTSGAKTNDDEVNKQSKE